MFVDMTLQEAQQKLKERLSSIYDSRESANIADWVIENITGWSKVDRLMHKQDEFPDEQLLEKYSQELLTHKPVQYVLHESWFSGLKLFVDESVLIPRPETEELVEWIVTEAKGKIILDIGTGSGCIPIALKKRLPQTVVYACDVSAKALQVAMKNAAVHDTLINFVQCDFLHSSSRSMLPRVDILVSNPPYIPLKDKGSMNKNVVDHEPHLALFVEDNDPLIFYEAIAGFAKTNLLPGGSIFVEIQEESGNAVQELFSKNGFSQITIRKDMQGKDRLLRATME